MKILAFITTITALFWMRSTDTKCCAENQEEIDELVLQTYLHSLR